MTRWSDRPVPPATQIGNGIDGDQSTPVHITGLTDVAQVADGETFSMARKKRRHRMDMGLQPRDRQARTHRRIEIYNSGGFTHLIIDKFGYFTSADA